MRPIEVCETYGWQTRHVHIALLLEINRPTRPPQTKVTSFSKITMLEYHIDSQRLEVDEAVHPAHGGSIRLVVDCYHGCVKGDAFLLPLNGGVRTGHLMPSEARHSSFTLKSSSLEFS